MARRGLAGFSAALIAFALATTGIATAGEGTVGEAAAKKCKKKPGKKKKCKKKKKTPVDVVPPTTTPPVTPTPPQPSAIVRATLTWNTDDRLNLFAKDPVSGSICHPFADGETPCANGQMAHGGRDTNGFGPESITDLQFLAGSARQFSYAICVGQDVAAKAEAVATLTHVLSSGATAVHQTGNQELKNAGALGVVIIVPPGGPPLTPAELSSTCD